MSTLTFQDNILCLLSRSASAPQDSYNQRQCMCEQQPYGQKYMSYNPNFAENKTVRFDFGLISPEGSVASSRSTIHGSAPYSVPHFRLSSPIPTSPSGFIDASHTYYREPYCQPDPTVPPEDAFDEDPAFESALLIQGPFMDGPVPPSNLPQVACFNANETQSIHVYQEPDRQTNSDAQTNPLQPERDNETQQPNEQEQLLTLFDRIYQVGSQIRASANASVARFRGVASNRLMEREHERLQQHHTSRFEFSAKLSQRSKTSGMMNDEDKQSTGNRGEERNDASQRDFCDQIPTKMITRSKEPTTCEDQSPHSALCAQTTTASAEHLSHATTASALPQNFVDMSDPDNTPCFSLKTAKATDESDHTPTVTSTVDSDLEFISLLEQELDDFS
ncbi:hypothetical protein EDD11_006630 [Mortierella claussenii]|nr:hypothetical protein EDD11_006630 [Mortierella claussenii]